MASKLQFQKWRCFTTMKVLQFPQQASTRSIHLRAIPESWSEPCSSSGGGLLSSWFADDFEPNDVAPGVNWGAVSGMALSLTFSAAFWAGVALIVERILR
jgi:hypothetical protein